MMSLVSQQTKFTVYWRMIGYISFEIRAYWIALGILRKRESPLSPSMVSGSITLDTRPASFVLSSNFSGLLHPVEHTSSVGHLRAGVYLKGMLIGSPSLWISG